MSEQLYNQNIFWVRYGMQNFQIKYSLLHNQLLHLKELSIVSKSIKRFDSKNFSCSKTMKISRVTSNECRRRNSKFTKFSTSVSRSSLQDTTIRKISICLHVVSQYAFGKELLNTQNVNSLIINKTTHSILSYFCPKYTLGIEFSKMKLEEWLWFLIAKFGQHLPILSFYLPWRYLLLSCVEKELEANLPRKKPPGNLATDATGDS